MTLGEAAIRWGSVPPLLFAAAAIMGSPGPATVSLVASASTYGARRSLAYLAGIVAGTTVVLLAVAAGVTAALVAVPVLRTTLLVVSAAYMLWLAYHIATAPPPGARSDAAAPSLAGGLLLGVANPKAWIAIAAVFSSTRLAHAALLDAAAKTLVLTAMIVLINSTWLAAGASLATLLRTPRWGRAINVVLATALVAATALTVLH